jgi:hypothetical protein
VRGPCLPRRRYSSKPAFCAARLRGLISNAGVRNFIASSNGLVVASSSLPSGSLSSFFFSSSLSAFPPAVFLASRRSASACSWRSLSFRAFFAAFFAAAGSSDTPFAACASPLPLVRCGKS